MIGIGKVFKNLMVDIQPTNAKLVERLKRIIMQATGVSYDKSSDYYEKLNGNVKAAIVMILAPCSYQEALDRLQKSEGFVRQALHLEK